MARLAMSLLGPPRLHLGHYAEALAEVRQEEVSAAWASYRWTRAFVHFIHGMALLALPSGGPDAHAAGGALDVLRDAAAGFEEVRHRESRGWAAGPLGLAAHLAGRPDLARREVSQALHTGLDMGVFMPLMYGLPVAARLLADGGHLERAAEVYACAMRSGFVAGSRWFDDLIGAPLRAALAHLPEETLAAAREQGRTLTWDEMARRVLAGW